MKKKGKKKSSNRVETTEKIITLITAIVSLVTAILTLVELLAR
nr:hypothetical protein [uncultured Catonella sp.]